MFAFLPGRHLYIDITGLFLGAVNLAHVQYPHHFRLWSGTKTEQQAELRPPYHNALLITTAQNDSSSSLKSLEGGEGVDNKWRWRRLKMLGKQARDQTV